MSIDGYCFSSKNTHFTGKCAVGLVISGGISHLFKGIAGGIGPSGSRSILKAGNLGSVATLLLLADNIR
ncbi:hypothetical protein DCM91_05965 [Chitinophaga costaii]|nr:hypothetical protein DCM91_05965 [Chitinophaga costaii]